MAKIKIIEVPKMQDAGKFTFPGNASESTRIPLNVLPLETLENIANKKTADVESRLMRAGMPQKAARREASRGSKMLATTKKLLDEQDNLEYRTRMSQGFDPSQPIEDQTWRARLNGLDQRLIRGANAFFNQSTGSGALDFAKEAMFSPAQSVVNMTADPYNRYIKPGIGESALNLTSDILGILPAHPSVAKASAIPVLRGISKGTSSILRAAPKQKIIRSEITRGPINWWETPGFMERNPRFNPEKYVNNINKFGKNSNNIDKNLNPFINEPLKPEIPKSNVNAGRFDHDVTINKDLIWKHKEDGKTIPYNNKTNKSLQEEYIEELKAYYDSPEFNRIMREEYPDVDIDKYKQVTLENLEKEITYNLEKQIPNSSGVYYRKNSNDAVFISKPNFRQRVNVANQNKTIPEGEGQSYLKNMSATDHELSHQRTNSNELLPDYLTRDYLWNNTKRQIKDSPMNEISGEYGHYNYYSYPTEFEVRLRQLKKDLKREGIVDYFNTPVEEHHIQTLLDRHSSLTDEYADIMKKQHRLQTYNPETKRYEVSDLNREKYFELQNKLDDIEFSGKGISKANISKDSEDLLKRWDIKFLSEQAKKLPVLIPFIGTGALMQNKEYRNGGIPKMQKGGQTPGNASESTRIPLNNPFNIQSPEDIIREENNYRLKVIDSINKAQSLKSSERETPLQRTNRIRRNTQFANVNPYAKVNPQTGELEKLDVDRDLTGKALPNTRAARNDKALEHAFGAMDAAGLAIPLLRGVGKGASSLLRTLEKSKQSGLLSNAYKLNPKALKEVQEQMLVRARPVGQDPYINMAEQLKAKQAAGEQLTWYQKNLLNPQTNPQMAAREKYFGQWFADNPSDLDFYINPGTRNFADDAQIEILKARMPKSEAAKYNVKNFEDAKSLSNLHDTEFILPKDMVQQLERYSVDDLSKLIKEYNEINKPHWLKGYKKVPDSKAKFQSEIDWGKWNKEIPDNKALMQEYNAIEQQAKANGTWMKNPDGSAFQGTPEQFVQQNSQNFKKAFPEYHGEILNHNTNAELNTIDESFFNKGAGDTGYYGKGTYTHPKKDYTKMYGKNNHEFYLNSKNKGFLDKSNINDAEYFKRSDDEILQHHLPEYENKLMNYELDPSRYYDNAKENWLNKLNEQVKAGKISRDKLDEFTSLHNPKNGEVVIPFNNRVKSAIGNNGMFDMTNPNIYKVLVPGILGAGALQQKTPEMQKGGQTLLANKTVGNLYRPVGNLNLRPIYPKGYYTNTFVEDPNCPDPDGLGCSYQATREAQKITGLPIESYAPANAGYRDAVAERYGLKNIFDQEGEQKRLANSHKDDWKYPTEQDFKNWKAGDIVVLDSGADLNEAYFPYDAPPGFSEKDLTKATHNGVVVGFTPDGWPVIRHGASRGKGKGQQWTEVLGPDHRVTDLGHGRYAIKSVWRPKEVDFDSTVNAIKPIVETGQERATRKQNTSSNESFYLDTTPEEKLKSSYPVMAEFSGANQRLQTKNKLVNLFNNKQLDKDLQYKLGLTASELNSLKPVVYGIFGQESNFNDIDNLGRASKERLVDALNIGSRGPAQIKFDSLTEKEREVLGIKKLEDLDSIDNSYKAAILLMKNSRDRMNREVKKGTHPGLVDKDENFRASYFYNSPHRARNTAEDWAKGTDPVSWWNPNTWTNPMVTRERSKDYGILPNFADKVVSGLISPADPNYIKNISFNMDAGSYPHKLMQKASDLKTYVDESNPADLEEIVIRNGVPGKSNYVKKQKGGLLKAQFGIVGPNCRGKCWSPSLKDKTGAGGGDMTSVDGAPVTPQELAASGYDIYGKKVAKQRAKDLAASGFQGVTPDIVAMAAGDSARLVAKFPNFEKYRGLVDQKRAGRLSGMPINDQNKILPYADNFLDRMIDNIQIQNGRPVPMTVPEILSQFTSPENYTQSVKSNYKLQKGGLTPDKARQILHDKSVHGYPLTDKQRRFFGAMSKGSRKYAGGGLIEDYNFLFEDYDIEEQPQQVQSPEDNSKQMFPGRVQNMPVIANTSKNKAKFAYDWFKSRGLSDHHAAGIVANLITESDNFADDVIDFRRKGDDNTAYGIAQWRGSRFEDLKRFSGQNKLNPAELETQLLFLEQEAKQRGNWEGLLKTKDLKEATHYFNYNYEVSADSRNAKHKYKRVENVLDSKGNIKFNS